MQVSANSQPLLSIFRLCEPKEIARSSAVCKLWNELIRNEDFNWELLLREFSLKVVSELDNVADTNYKIYSYLQNSHWNVRKGTFLQSSSSKIKRPPVIYSEYTPDSKRNVSFNLIDNTCCITATENETTKITVLNDPLIKAIRILSNELAVSASSDRVIKLWDLFTGNCLQEVICTYEIVALEVIPKKDIILIASRRAIFGCSSQLEAIKLIQTEFSHLTSMAISPDQRTMVISAVDAPYESYLQFWDIDEWKPLHTVHFPEGISHEDDVSRSTSCIRIVLFSDAGAKILIPTPYFTATLDFGHKLS